jgi:hypothetical protein
MSPGLGAGFSKGDQLYATEGVVIELPERRAGLPGQEFLPWDLDRLFRS